MPAHVVWEEVALEHGEVADACEVLDNLLLDVAELLHYAALLCTNDAS